ncbi:YcaO-like family protein [Streptomyces sp. NPDC093097]|uniref:YcaO-like family protein n=1 Tax=Streptomyces sp. NPDC093097 TaxID=3366027 RepID=UPI0037FD18AA
MTSEHAGDEPGRPWPVQTFVPFPTAPDLFFARTAARSQAFSANDAAGGRPVLIGAAAGTDRAEVAVRARGELAERVDNVLAGRQAEAGRRGSVAGSYDVLRRKGTPVLDPATWPELRSAAHELRTAEMLWVPGTSLTHGHQTLVPACAVYLAHRPPPGCAAPLHPGSTGLAAHHTRSQAGRHAALEVLERHLLWHAWYSNGPRTAYATGAEPTLSQPLRETLTALGVLATFVVLPGPAHTACVVACLHAADRTGQSFGARATHLTTTHHETLPRAAADAACHEALMVRWSLGTTAAHTAWRRLQATGDEPPYGPLEHALHTYHRQDSLAHLLTGSTPQTPNSPPGRHRPKTPGDELTHLAHTLADLTENDVVLVDTTRATGHHGPGEAAAVVRLVAPGMHRLPADERTQRPPTDARTRLPHPLG